MIDRGHKLKEVLRSLTYELCVITGDFRYLTYGDYIEAVCRMTDLANAIHCEHGILAILGNHDFIEMVPPLEKAGIPVLLNESVPIRRGEDTIWIVGVDDTHYYEMDDLPKAMKEIPPEPTKILLAHSPEIIPEAYEAGIDYYLCGHTHGGQICLPGQVPIINNSHCGRRYISGGWMYKEGMVGYTSRGTGNSLLPVRFNCFPEVTLHQLV
jgi:predicted MPP superfamily phosphohydrolase